MIVELLTEHHLEFLSFKGGCTGSSESMSKCHIVGNHMYWLKYRERCGSVVECLTLDRRAGGSCLTGVTALWSLSKTHLS